MKKTIYMNKNRYKRITFIILCYKKHIPELAQLAEHLTVVVYSISKGHLFESGIPDIIYNNFKLL